MKNYTNPIPMCFIEKSPFNSSAEERLLAIRQLTSAGFKLFIYLEGDKIYKFFYKTVENVSEEG